MSVALVAPSLEILGGQAVQANLLIERLNRIPGLRVELVAINPPLPGPLRKLQRVKYLRTVVTSVRYLLALLLRLRHYDLVHIFSASYFSFVLAPTPALLVARMYNRPTILNYRSGEARDHLANWGTAVRTAKLATEIVTPSDYLVKVFGDYGLAARSIPNVVDVRRFAYRERSPLRPLFLANRNFEAHYDVACTLDAFARIQEVRPDAELLIAGDGPLRADLEARAKRLGLRSVEFLGLLPHARMPELYDRADIYLNTPRIDNMPNSILEAHAMGMPVVTTDAGGIPYIVEDGRTARMVPVGDSEAVALAALELLDDPAEASRLARAGRAEVEERYVWEVVREQWVGLYDELRGRT